MLLLYTYAELKGSFVQAQASALKLHLDHGRRMQGWGGIFGKVMGNSKEQGHTLKIPKSNSGDSVASYFAMRKSSMGRTADGGLRPLLNNKFIFQTGMLDQVNLRNAEASISKRKISSHNPFGGLPDLLCAL